MIEYIKGELTSLSPTLAVVEAGGVGYGLGISLATYAAIEHEKEVKLLVVEVIREDAHSLWGFATQAERELFLLLTSVSGIGGATARVALSAMSPEEMVEAISGGDERALKSIKGIGPKAAQRMIVELRDKVLGLGLSPAPGRGTGKEEGLDVSKEAETRREAVAALTMLGFPPSASHKVVVSLMQGDPSMGIEEVIKKALKML